MKPINIHENIKNIQERYRSGLLSLLYLVKHSRPELSNAVRDLSKYMYEANTSHHKAPQCTIKELIDTKKY